MSKIISFERSFAAHPKSQYWNYERNIGKPSDYALNSHKKCWFDCNKCGHCFDNTLHALNSRNTWCSYCANTNLCNDNNCKICYEKSFASVNISSKWSSKNIIQPRLVFKYSHKKYLFDCNCGHIYEQLVSHMTRGNNNCLYCGHIKLCDKNDCINCLKNSFASVDKCVYWNEKNILQPRQVFKNSAKKYWFDCNKCNHIFSNRLSHITDGVWCTNCVNKTESMFYDHVFQIYPYLIKQFKVDWCKNKKSLPFDFVIEDRKIIIELDGIQHLGIQIGKWKTPHHNRERDLYKMKCANENGYSIIRILQEDVWKNKFDWLQEVIKMIEKITIDNIVQNVYICKNNEYNNFESELFIA